MTTPDQPSCRLIARLYNARDEIVRAIGAPVGPGQGAGPALAASDVEAMLKRARRAVSREAGVGIPAVSEPTPAAAHAALAAAVSALDEVGRRYSARRS